jgi:hypothetical protein
MTVKNDFAGQVWWFMSVILASWEAEVGELRPKAGSGQKCTILYQKNS